MKDIQNKLAQFEMEILDCELIAKMAVDPEKRAAFQNLVKHYQAMCDQLRAILNKQDVA